LGEFIIKSIESRISALEREFDETCDQLEQMVGTDPSQFVVLLVSFAWDESNPSSVVIKALVESAGKTYKEMTALKLVARGFDRQAIYVLSVDDMKKYGLGLLETS
jgi:hypothetical protein